MNKYLLVIAMSMVVKLGAQIQITQTHMPSINDTIRYSTATGTTFNFVQKGANFNWNYSNLGITGQGLYKYEAVTSTPYSILLLSKLPFGAIGYKVADSIGAGQFAFKNLYNFYEKKSNVWRSVGTGFTLSVLPVPTGGINSDPDEIYTLPLNYNDSDFTTFQVTTPLGNQLITLGSYKQKGTRINKVEGWGTITTPYGSNIACLKIKSIVTEIDSIKISTPAVNLGFPADRVEYRWLSTTEKIPVLEVIGTEVGGNFTPTQVRYRDRFRNPGASPLGPRIKFDADKYTGKAGKDTFYFINQSRPNIGNTYQWSFNPNKGIRFVEGTSATSGTPIVVFDSAGVYSVTLKGTNLGGSNDSTATNMITIQREGQNQSIGKIEQQQMAVYPNPVNGDIYLNQSELAGFSAYIFDYSGRLINQSIIDQRLTLSTSDLTTGSYILVLRSESAIYYTTFIKE